MSHDAAPPDPCGTLRGPMALPLEAEPPPDSDYLSLLKYRESFWKMSQIGSSLRLNKSISALRRLTSNKVLNLHPNFTIYMSLNRLQLKKYASITHYWSRLDSDINQTNSSQHRFTLTILPGGGSAAWSVRHAMRSHGAAP